MVAEPVEYSILTATIQSGSDVDGATLGSIGGTLIKGTHVLKTQTSPEGNITYTILVVHDTAAGPTALEYSVRTVEIANDAAPSVDNVYTSHGHH